MYRNSRVKNKTYNCHKWFSIVKYLNIYTIFLNPHMCVGRASIKRFTTDRNILSLIPFHYSTFGILIYLNPFLCSLWDCICVHNEIYWNFSKAMSKGLCGSNKVLMYHLLVLNFENINYNSTFNNCRFYF